MERSLVLGSLEASARDVLFRKAARKVFEKDTLIFAYGEPGNSMMLIDTGRVEISVTTEQGRKCVLGHMGPGELVGELAMLDGGTRSADVTAVVITTGLLVTFNDFRSFLKTNPEIMLSLLQGLTAKIRNANALVEDRAQKDASARLARCVLRLAQKWGKPTDGGGIYIRQTFSQSDIGELASLARENVNRRFRSWMEEEILHFDDAGRMILPDPAALEKIASRGS
ncbi:MAG: Crp/Fnr family transcriptional regulator [Paracoccaceae bacterium]